MVRKQHGGGLKVASSFYNGMYGKKESCRTQVTEMDEQKTLTLDFIKSLMEPAYTLIWTDYNDNLDNHCGLIQKMP